MRIRLGSSFMWSLPSWERDECLNKSQPLRDIEFDELSEEEKAIVAMSLKAGTITDATNEDGSGLGQLGESEEAIQSYLELSVPKFRKQVVKNIQPEQIALVDNLIKAIKASSHPGKRPLLQMLLPLKKGMISPKDPFIGDIGVDSKWATLEKIEIEEPTKSMDAGKLITKFETWAKDNNKELGESEFTEFMETL